MGMGLPRNEFEQRNSRLHVRGRITMPLSRAGELREIVKADLQIGCSSSESRFAEFNRARREDSAAEPGFARSEVQVANGVELAKEEVDQARDRFKAGVANNIEVSGAGRLHARTTIRLRRFTIQPGSRDYARGIDRWNGLHK